MSSDKSPIIELGYMKIISFLTRKAYHVPHIKLYNADEWFLKIEIKGLISTLSLENECI